MDFYGQKTGFVGNVPSTRSVLWTCKYAKNALYTPSPILNFLGAFGAQLLWPPNVKSWLRLCIGVDLAGLLGGRMASDEGGSVPSEVGYGERRELPQLVPGQQTDFAAF